MSRSSVRRGQVEPLAALAAVFVLGTAVSAYAFALDRSGPTEADRDRDLAAPTLDRVLDQVRRNGAIDPDLLAEARTLGPDGHQLSVTIRANGDTWQAGPDPPPGADAATEPVGVIRRPGRVDRGRITVVVWS